MKALIGVAGVDGCFCPRRGLPRSSATILIDLVWLFVCLSEISRRFTEWHLHRLHSILARIISRPSKTDPSKKTFKHGKKHVPGPDFFRFFWKMDSRKTACPGGVRGTRNTSGERSPAID